MPRACIWRALIAVALAWGGLPGAYAAGSGATGVVQTGPLETAQLHLHTLKELKLLRAFSRTWQQQYDFSCGSAALATLLTFQYGRPTDETSVFKAMYAVGDQAQIRAKGFSLLDMKRYLASVGYTADGVRVSLDTLRSVGIPAIALIADRGYRHFVVIKGADGSRVLIGDPALGRRILSRHDFEKERVGNLFFVIRSDRKLARFNLSADWQSQTSPPLSVGVDRNLLGTEFLNIPNESRF